MKDQLTLKSLWAVLHRRRRVVYWSLAIWVVARCAGLHRHDPQVPGDREIEDRQAKL